jgi:amino acid transporter
MTALVINTIIGSGIFGLPSDLIHLLGRASPLAFLLTAVAMSLIALCMAEVASQFSEPGGPYLYVRTAFGRFAGAQTAWFHFLAMVGTGAANAALFIAYLGGLFPWSASGWHRAAVLSVLIIIPGVAHYVGVRSGASLTSLLTIAKLLPLVLIVALGMLRLRHHFEMPAGTDLSGTSGRSWITAFLLLVFMFGGFEDAMVPAGEVEKPRHTVPFALLLGLFSCAILYTLVQFVTVATIGTSGSERPLAQTASVLMAGGSLIVTLAVMISTYGTLFGCILNCPRLVCSLATKGDFPSFLGALHRRFNTPATAIVTYVGIVWVLAMTGNFLWAVMVVSGSTVLIYAGTCAALIRLRQRNPEAEALRVPWGKMLATVGCAIALSLLTQLETRQVLVIAVTAVIATANWWWVKRNE